MKLYTFINIVIATICMVLLTAIFIERKLELTPHSSETFHNQTNHNQTNHNPSNLNHFNLNYSNGELAEHTQQASDSANPTTPNDRWTIMVPVYLTDLKKIETIALEAYVRGVVAAEMPAQFDIEALKAQAIAARTYIIRRIQLQDFSDVPGGRAFVTDAVTHQAYVTKDHMIEKWDDDFLEYFTKVTNAVQQTEGLILTYQGEAIHAAYFSTSNGYTENAEEYWSHAFPYLQSVVSPWDVDTSTKYKTTTYIDDHQLYRLLGIAVTPSHPRNLAIQVLERTEGKRIKQILP